MMGKIGKPQRTQKHKKIKAVDPFYFGPRTVDRKAGSRNKPPKNDDEDSYLPGSVKEIMHLQKQATKQGKKKKRNKFKKGEVPDYSQDPLYQKNEKGMSRPLKAVPVFKQHHWETEAAFNHRMSRETRDVVRHAQLEEKFNVDIEETAPGEFKVEKRKLPEEEEEEQHKKKKKARNQKKAEKHKEIKLEKLKDRVENFEEFQDEVAFGEVAMAPPTLTAKPRRVDSKTNRPGTKSLLLKDLVQSTSQDPLQSMKRQPGQTVKRKHMSMAQQRIMDSERERVIDMYRKMKKKQKRE